MVDELTPQTEDEKTLEKQNETDSMKRRYMASKHIEWAPFCTEINVHPATARVKYPVRNWVDEKRRELAKNEAESIAQAVFEHKSFWHKEALKTLRHYPETCEAVHTVIRQRVNDLLETIGEDRKGGTKEFRKTVTRELRELAAATKMITEAKYKSLLLDGWAVKLADGYVDENKELAPTIDMPKGDDPSKFIVEVKSLKPMSGDDFRAMMVAYDDPPHGKPDVEAEVVKLKDSPEDTLPEALRAAMKDG